MDYSNLIGKVGKYKDVKANTIKYREQWHGGLKDTIMNTLEEIKKQTDLVGQVEYRDDVENLEAVTLDLGRHRSGIREKLDGDEYRSLVRNNGVLIYQQLFNGKIMVMMLYPQLEGYAEPQPPKTMEIVRPEELTNGFIVRHIEEFLKELTNWEDYDDDQPSPPPIGFNKNFQINSEIIED